MVFEIREEIATVGDYVTTVKEKCIARLTEEQIKPEFHNMEVNQRRQSKLSSIEDDRYRYSVVRVQ